MPREIHLRFRELVEQKKPDITRVELADQLGISEGTLRGYLDDHWTVLDRAVLERFADLLDCEASELLETRPGAFFAPFQDLSDRSCFYLRRPDADTLRETKPLAYIDDRALATLTTLLANLAEGTKVFPSSATTLPELATKMGHNCVSVAAPGVNPASEMALCQAFNLPAFEPASQAPFRFRWHPIQRRSPSSFGETATDGLCGIFLPNENQLIIADYCPLEEFRRTRMRDARDCAVVLVMNRTADSRTRKLIVLAGFSGAGTEAAAELLAEDYRELEPLETERFVWGIVEVLYRKESNTVDRTITNRGWRLRVGGRNPISIKPKQLAARGGTRK